MFTFRIPSLLSPIGILHTNHIAFAGFSYRDVSVLATSGALDDLFGHKLTFGVYLRENFFTFLQGIPSLRGTHKALGPTRRETVRPSLRLAF
jgi:hypothetical protein